MAIAIDADYLVVGAGATGMAFTDALIDHADVTVALADVRDGPGGHWRDDYPFVRLHQASSFYGVASTRLGDDRIQTEGPERGLHERATGAEVRDYYEGVLAERLVASGRVEPYLGWEHIGGRRLRSVADGAVWEARPGCRVVDARYLGPQIPALTPPPFEVDPDARVVTVNELPSVRDASRVVVAGSGKTATDAVVWLLEGGVDPDAVTWIRPRDPWMYNRAVVQPDPLAIARLGADTMEAAAGARSLDHLFVRLEDAGIMLRIDPAVTPTMAKTPTLARWELELLRSVEHVVRLGHLRRVSRGRLRLDRGEVEVPDDAVVVHCAADGLRRPGLLPIWRTEAVTPQPIRTGFPCFGAALAGYVEATRDTDADKNGLCPPTPYSDTPAQWAEAAVLGARASSRFLREPDIRAWADTVALNPARTPAPSAELDAVRERLRRHKAQGLARLAQLGGVAA